MFFTGPQGSGVGREPGHFLLDILRRVVHHKHVVLIWSAIPAHAPLASELDR